MSGAVFRGIFTVRLGDCDPAGIVSYPRYVEMLNNVCEEWFEQSFDMPCGRMHGEEHRGVPIVDLHVRFQRPSRLGEKLEFSLVLTHLGRSAVDLEIVADCEGKRRLNARLKLVHSDLAVPKVVTIPPELRERMKPFLAEADA